MTFKILSFKAENFRSLRGIELEFSTQIDKPLTVIRAENGSGKTTILEAMKWCLFGDRALPRKRAEYPMIPSDWNELEGIDQKAIIATEMMFEISSKFNHREDESIKYKIRRECSEKYVEYESADVVNSEDVFLYKCTKLGQIQQEDAEQQIEYVILRNNLKDVFFTDGDAVNAKISNSSPTERAEFVKNTVKTLLGVEIIEKMYSRLDNQTKRIDREIRTVAGAGDLSAILDTLETKKDNLDDLKEKLNQVSNKKIDAQKVYDLRDQDLKNCLAAGGQDRKDLLDQLRSAEARYKNAEANVESSYKTFARSLNNDLIAPLIASEAINCAQVFLNDLQEKQIIPNYKPDLMRLILKNQECVCGAPVKDGNEQEHHIKNVLDQFQANNTVHALLSDLNPFLGILQSDIDNAQYELPENIQNAEKNVSLSIQSLKDSGAEIRKMEASIAKLEDTNLDTIEREKQRAFNALGDFQRTSGTLEEQIKNEQKSISQLEEKRDNLAKNEDKLSRFRYAKEAIHDLDHVIGNVLGKLNGDTLIELSEELNRLFLLMTSGFNGISKFSKAELDSNYCIWVYLSDGKRQDPRDLSGAERRAYVLSFIFAAVNISREFAPCIIDTPLGMASGELKRQMLLESCTNSKQLVLFLTRSEINGVSDILDDYCGKYYTMSNTGDYPAKLETQPSLPGKQSVLCTCSYNDLVGCPTCKRKNVRS